MSRVAQVVPARKNYNLIQFPWPFASDLTGRASHESTALKFSLKGSDDSNIDFLQLYCMLNCKGIFGNNARQALYKRHCFSGNNRSIPVTNTYSKYQYELPGYWCGIGNMGDPEIINRVDY